MEKKRKKSAGGSRKRFYRNVFRMVTCFLILFLILNLFVPSKDFSAKENRSLAQRPSLTWASLRSGDFFKNFDTYYADQFVFRDFWMTLGSYGDTLAGRKESGGVYIGKNGYLIGKPNKQDSDAMMKTAEAVTDFASRHEDLDMYMMIAPTAANIISSQLPASAPVEDQVKDIKRLEDQISGVNMIDVSSVLKSHKDANLYYKTDHHWTSEGAYTVFAETASQMGIEEELVNYTPRIVSESFQGTLASKTGRWSSEDTITVYEPETTVEYMVYYPDSGEKSASMFNSSMLLEKDQYTMFFGGNHPVVEIRTTSDSDKSLLVFKDSYANCYMQFLYPYYSKIIMIDPRYYYDNIETAMTSYGITDVLFLYSGDTLAADTNLADTLNAGLTSETESGDATVTATGDASGDVK